jgi:hypothetical protein
MNYCTRCGAELGLGRFCTNCGAPISGDLPPDFPGGTAIPPPLPPDSTSVRPIIRPAAFASGGRYPLYADEAVLSRVAARMEPVPPPRRHAAQKSWVVPILILLVAMLAAATAGIWLAKRDSGTASAQDPNTAPSGPLSQTPSESSDAPSTDAPTPGPGKPANLAPGAEVDAPPPVPPGIDLANRRVNYRASNMLDDDPESAYRVPGDATGAVITFRLPETSKLIEVGLLNGYAKTDTRGGRTIDWYEKNRRIMRVEWRFDDGTSVVQDLESTREMQLLEIKPEKTGTVELRILEVSAPGPGPLSKDVTAISDVLLLGS